MAQISKFANTGSTKEVQLLFSATRTGCIHKFKFNFLAWRSQISTYSGIRQFRRNQCLLEKTWHALQTDSVRLGNGKVRIPLRDRMPHVPQSLCLT